MRKKVTEQLRRAFRPEFLNRVSATIVFRSLTKEEITAIVDLELNKVRERVFEHALVLDVTDAAKSLLAEKGYDPEYGARPLRRVITNLVEDKLSDGILSDAAEDEITFTPLQSVEVLSASDDVPQLTSGEAASASPLDMDLDFSANVN
jgi:ATP-dependent Clp protease ATP-binding subunit ClpA